MVDPDTPLWQLTVRQFLELQEQKPEPEIKTEKKYVYGISGLLNCLTVRR